jgi:formate hydrogenlyase subunit 3/multisubunit Na+/H+ antiporter MnhD subunit
MRSRILSLLWLAPLPALAAAVLAAGQPPLMLPGLGATLALDVPGAILLGVAAVLWIAAGIYAATYLRADPNAGRFATWWLLALSGNVGVFMAADIASFYLFFAMGSLSAYGLITHDGSAREVRAGAVYVAFALLGEACVLMGLVLLAAAAPDNSLLIRDAVAALPSSPWRDPALALLIAGFGLKLGLVPLHMWMPLTYTASPIPAAAVLSGAAVKAGVIGFIRFMPFDAAMTGWGEALAAVGLFSAFYGVAIGLTQANPKTVLAYSSVSQMGLIAAVIGMGLAGGDSNTALAAGFIAAHHVLVKGALFLAIGVAAATGASRLWLVLAPAAVIALGLAGLPLTGGALAKAASKAPLGDGVAGDLAALAAAGTALLMLHFLKCLAAVARPTNDTPPPPGLTLPWLGIAPAAVAIPWALFPSAMPGGFAEVISIAGLWAALWPIVIGALLAIWLWRRPQTLPQIPEGDFGGLVLNRGLRAATACGAAFERSDVLLRQWPVAGVSLLALTVALGAALVIGH